jgi:hypothetical protein
LKIHRYHRFWKLNKNNIKIKVNKNNLINNRKIWRELNNNRNQVNYLVKLIKIIRLLYNFKNKVHHLFLKIKYIKNNLLLSMVVMNKIKLFNLFFNIKVVKI